MVGQLRHLPRPDPRAPAVVVEHLTETFRLYHERPRGLKERLYRPRRSTYEDFNALEDVSFTVACGETVGIIGPNGSGKSTLLKVLARILPPDRGRVEIRGRVATLLELGAGFHGDLSGRENIYLNGAILGLTRAEIEERFDAIVDFAGIRPFLDTPVRNYSSGMYVRLGFSIAVHVDPDILLIDEVLAVGDAVFQARSLERLRAFQRAGRTIVLVSHDLNAVEDLCDRTIVLHNGRVEFDGPAREGVALYAQLMATAGLPEDRPGRADRFGTRAVEIAGATLVDSTGTPARRILPSTPLTLRVRVRANRPVDACSVGAVFRTGDGRHVYEVHSTWHGVGVGPLAPGQTATVDFRVVPHVLAGHYTVTPMVTDAAGRVVHDSLPEALVFEVQPTPGGTGTTDFQAQVAVSDGPAVALDAGREEEVSEDAAAEA